MSAVIMSGAGVISREQFDSFMGEVMSSARHCPQHLRGEPTTEPMAPVQRTPAEQERDTWNAAVEQRKADKLARRQG